VKRATPALVIILVLGIILIIGVFDLTLSQRTTTTIAEQMETLESTSSSQYCQALQGSPPALNQTISAIRQNATFASLAKGTAYHYSRETLSYVRYENGTIVCQNITLSFDPPTPGCAPTIEATVVEGGTITAITVVPNVSNHGETQSSTEC